MFVKSPSTPRDQSIGVVNGLTLLAERLGLDSSGLLARTVRLVHGSTVATNALLERRGARVGLLTTAGHRDVLEMREGLKEERYNLRMAPPEPLVPRHLRLPVAERIRADGSILLPLQAHSLEAALTQLAAEQVEAVAVCYLHAWRNPVHEAATREAIERAMPGVFVSLSSEVLPQIKEFERVSTTVVNAAVGPVMRRYLAGLNQRLQALGYRGALSIILSHGGVAPVDEAAARAAATVLSGPAGGIAGARRWAELLGTDALIPFDMGGTSTDIALIDRGEAALTSERGIAGQRIALRSLDIASIGAGGGSIATIGAGATLRVGPESAGADPGPACYGRGGRNATVTDANLLLGYLDAEAFGGGAHRLDRDAAKAAVGRVAAALGVAPDAAASGIYRMINLAMADGIRIMTVRRGVDPRRFTLLSFGGAAGLHAVEVARLLEIPRVVVPRNASVLSAWGMLVTPLRYEASRTHIGDVASLSDDGLRAQYAALEREARARTEGWFDAEPALQRSAEMRYGEQIFEIEVTLDGLDWDASGLMDRVIARFHRRHEELYTYASPEQDVVLVNARLAAVGAVEIPPATPLVRVAAQPGPPRVRAAWFGEWREARVVELEALSVGDVVEGPAIVEAATTTVVLGPGDRAQVDWLGSLDIRLGAAAKE